MDKAKRKTHGSASGDDTTGKQAKIQEDEEGDMMAWLSLDDEKMTELSKVLDPDTASFRVRFIDDPYTPPMIVKSSSDYITINGNEESCGSSFSDLDSSAMASIDRGSLSGIFEAITGVAWGPDANDAGGSSWNWVKQLNDEDLFGCHSGEKIHDDDEEANFMGEDLFGSWNSI